MANVNTTLVSNLLASPQVANPSRTLHGTKRTAMGTIALAAGDLSATDTVMLAPIPSNAGIVSIVLYNDDIDSGTTITCDVGVYSESGGTFTAQDDDAYASAITTFRGAVAGAGTDVTFEARAIEKHGQAVWEDAGLSADPGGYLFIGLLFDAAGDTGGDLSFTIEYVVN
tara:strand:+ start:353 stop:862 length:510 start_codon:yes stop_codon:yes gene_type:complete